MYRILTLILLTISAVTHGQTTSTEESSEFQKAQDYYNDGAYELAYNYIQIVKLTKVIPEEKSSVLEIKTLQKLDKHEECLQRINYCMSNLNYSLSDLTAISEIKTQIQNDKAFQKRVAVEKLKMTEKVKNENASWNSVMDKAKSSLKSIIGN